MTPSNSSASVKICPSPSLVCFPLPISSRRSITRGTLRVVHDQLNTHTFLQNVFNYPPPGREFHLPCHHDHQPVAAMQVSTDRIQVEPGMDPRDVCRALGRRMKRFSIAVSTFSCSFLKRFSIAVSTFSCSFSSVKNGFINPTNDVDARPTNNATTPGPDLHGPGGILSLR